VNLTELNELNWPVVQQQEPLSLISFITMTTIVDFLYTGQQQPL
jgi:hypothetical protein